MTNLLNSGNLQWSGQLGTIFYFYLPKSGRSCHGDASREASVPEILKSHLLLDLDLHHLRIMNGDLNSAEAKILHGPQDEIQEGEGMGFLFGVFSVRK